MHIDNQLYQLQLKGRDDLMTSECSGAKRPEAGKKQLANYFEGKNHILGTKTVCIQVCVAIVTLLLGS